MTKKFKTYVHMFLYVLKFLEFPHFQLCWFERNYFRWILKCSTRKDKSYIPAMALRLTNFATERNQPQTRGSFHRCNSLSCQIALVLYSKITITDQYVCYGINILKIKFSLPSPPENPKSSLSSTVCPSHFIFRAFTHTATTKICFFKISNCIVYYSYWFT